MKTQTNTTKKTTPEQKYREALESALVDCHIKAGIVNELVEAKIKYLEDETIDWGCVGSLNYVAKLLGELQMTLEGMA